MVHASPKPPRPVRNGFFAARNLSLFGAIVTGALVLSSFAPDPKVVIMWAGIFALMLAGRLYGRRMAAEILLAALFAFLLNLFVPHVYVTDTVSIGRFNLFSFVSWTAGLVFLREVYKAYRWRFRWLVMTGLYLGVLLLLEYIGFHLLGIRLIGNEPSYLGLGVLHGTPILHIVYMLAGPLYMLAGERLRFA